MNHNNSERPTSHIHFRRLLAAGHQLWTHCLQCSEEFSTANTHSPAGWRETQISGWCEDCFDSQFAEDPEEGEGDEPAF